MTVRHISLISASSVIVFALLLVSVGLHTQAGADDGDDAIILDFAPL